MSDPCEVQRPTVAFMRIVFPCYFTGGSLEIKGGRDPFRSIKKATRSKKPQPYYPVISSPSKNSNKNFHVEAWYKGVVTYSHKIMRGLMVAAVFTLHYHRAKENISSLIPSPTTLKSAVFLENKLKAVFQEWTNHIEHPQEFPDEVVPRKIVVRLPDAAKIKGVDLLGVFEQAATNKGYWMAQATLQYSEEKDVSLNPTNQDASNPHTKEQLVLKTRDPQIRLVRSGLKRLRWVGRNTPMWAKRLNTILDMCNEWEVDHVHEVVEWKISEDDVVPEMDWRNVNFEEATGTVKCSKYIN